ncbi:hypothetical protein [Shewanella pealeana]|uniref:Uncharacterized protein n=1 Tax=Shewanella pealeana (strain ATCC 700345 / ANG-SQ1) TaxID=398579 RepID=A8GZR5_SHEPA|nr:hypothetical protein [Shewanella pealeana]ABV85802.1 hypothetical protein Spea_0474 [Shewanella pealeana ATCC 700345]
MASFSISRLNTSVGIVKLAGDLDLTGSINISQLSIMATDGWQALDIDHQHSQNLIKQIQDQIISHLANKLN